MSDCRSVPRRFIWLIPDNRDLATPGVLRKYSAQLYCGRCCIACVVCQREPYRYHQGGYALQTQENAKTAFLQAADFCGSWLILQVPL
jgi:hypothetical protein